MPHQPDEDAEEPVDETERLDRQSRVWFEMRIGYPGPPDDGSPRTVRREWYSRRTYINLPPPTNDVEARALVMEIGVIVLRDLVTRRRLKTMGR